MEDRTDDWALLDAYVRNGSHEAFGRVVGRYADFVFATARRQVRDRQLAEDVTQSVFIVLARRAAGLRAGGSLAGWLHRTTMLASSNALRAENRRRRHEKEAVDLAANPREEDFSSTHAAADLDSALEKMGRADRDVLSLHYLEGRPVVETAEILGISAEAAKKRLFRAMARLRQLLANRGVALPAAGIPAGLIALGKPTAQASAAVAEKVVAGGGGGNSFTLARDVIHAMKIMTLQKIAAVAFVSIFIVGAALGVVTISTGRHNPSASTQPANQNIEQPIYLDAKTGSTPVIVTVTDKDSAAPIAGATIAKLVPIGTTEEGGSWETKQEIVGTTDNHGVIQLQCDPAQRVAFLITAPGESPKPFGFWGFVPANYHIAMAREPGTMSGRILDAAGKAIANAAVRLEVQDYSLVQALRPSPDYPIYCYAVESRTDDTGHFSFVSGDLAEGSVQIEENGVWYPASQQDYYGQIASSLRDGTFVGHPMMDSPVTIADLVPATQPSAGPNLTIHLRVVDADTNQPIQNIHVTPGGTAPGRIIQTLSGEAVDLPGNEITWSFYDDATTYFLRVEADGYAETPTRVVEAAEKNSDVEVRMSKATKAEVTVLTPNGQPAAGAKAYLATPTICLDMAPLDTGKHESLAKPIGVAGDDGVIHFTPPGEAYRLAISHADGWAEVAPSSDADTVTLTGWASADFTIESAGKALPGAIVGVQSGFSEDQQCWINWEDNYFADDNGHLSLANCHGGNNHYYIEPPAGADVSWRSVDVARLAKPGQHSNNPIMTGKTTVRGTLIQPEGYKWSKYLNIRPDGPAADLPEGVNLLPRKALIAAVKDAERRAPNKKAAETVMQFINIEATADGAFSVTGLGPGTYELSGFADPKTRAADAPASAAAELLAIHWFFSIPPTEPETVDVGEVSESMTEK